MLLASKEAKGVCFCLGIFECFLSGWLALVLFFVGFTFVGGRLIFQLMKKEIIDMENWNSHVPRVLILMYMCSIIIPYSTILLEKY